MASQAQKMVVEAVGVFDAVDELDAAVEELRQAGFRRSEISLLASADAVERKLGHRYERVEELEDNPDAPRKAYTTRESLGESESLMATSLTYLPALLAAGTVVASAGVVAAAVTGAAVAGAAVATVLSHWMDKSHAEWLEEQLDRGGLLLWVRTATPEAEGKALEILRKHSAHDVHLHKLPRSE
jgi:orotate phosphoribosyltransferase-like protein